MRRLNLPIDVTESLPDVVLYSAEDNKLLVVEAVASTGPIDMVRLAQLRAFCQGPSLLGVHIELLTAFPSRKDLRRFVEEIAWGTGVWISDEPWSLIHFVTIASAGQNPGMAPDPLVIVLRQIARVVAGTLELREVGRAKACARVSPRAPSAPKVVDRRHPRFEVDAARISAALAL